MSVQTPTHISQLRSWFLKYSSVTLNISSPVAWLSSSLLNKKFSVNLSSSTYLTLAISWQRPLVGMHRYHFFTNRYEYEYLYLCTCRYRVPIQILLRFGLHESAINLEADFILSSADYVKPKVQNEQKAIPSQK